MTHIHSKIKEAIYNDKLVLFIGSGMSIPLGFPNWGDLVKIFLTELSKDYTEYALLLETLEKGFLSEISILQLINKHRPRILEILDQTFQLDELDAHKLDKHMKLGQITSKIVTTNYDKALEYANPTFTKVVHNNDFRVAKLTNTSKYIFKIHGCIDNPASCILFEEDYKNLYNCQVPALEEFKKIIADHVILFIGFSLSDPYVLFQLEYIKNIYQNFKSNHFIVTTRDFPDNINNVESIKISDWEVGLDSFLDKLLEIKQSVHFEDTSLKKDLVNKAIDEQTEVKVAVLIASPVDRNLGVNLDDIRYCFKNLKMIINCFHLSIEALNNLIDYDYIFIFSNTYKNKIILESEYINSTLISIEELENEILVEDNLKGLIIILDKTIENIDNQKLNLPIIIDKYSKDNLRKLIFIIFKKADINVLKDNYTIFNIMKIKPCKIPNGKPDIQYKKSKLSTLIDTKNLNNFIGRSTDVENIIRKVINLNKEILNIKGAGGIGKTTIIKKIAIELSNRNFFSDGIFFIECENIADYEILKIKIGQCFNLDTSIDFIELIKQNEVFLNSLIILDNFESLLHLKDTDKIKYLVSFICDYSIIVITSRETVGFEFENNYMN